MEHKRAQLRQLSQALQACSAVQPPAAPTPTEMVATTREPVTAGVPLTGDSLSSDALSSDALSSNALSSDALSGDAVDGTHRVPGPQASLCGSDARKPDVALADSPSSPTEADPMARLNAIKLRLAKQIENH